MYIKKAEITNIKSIEKFEIEFKNPAGWHVLIGDNGSGKSTIVRAIALALVGEKSQSLRENWTNWLSINADNGEIIVNLYKNKNYDLITGENIGKIIEDETNVAIILIKNQKQTYMKIVDGSLEIPIHKLSTKEFCIIHIDPTNVDSIFGHKNIVEAGFFSSAFGPFRRFEGGNSEWDEVYNSPSLANLAAHLSIFNESVALSEPIKWLKDLNYKTLEKNKESKHTLDNLKKLINSEDFLPHNSKLEKISSDGVFFKDGNGSTIAVNQMSDGYRSILSLTFELIRQLVRVYGSDKVFKNIEKGEMFIDLPGVVLIDEIDAHLHPTWQTRIGQWFLKYFPQLQFIVTTHSPLVCRACEKGSIWRLAAPGSDEESGEVTGIDRDRLIYGNILDAYGTGVFGENTSISQDSNKMLNRLSELNVKSMLGLINDKENDELQVLRAKAPTEDTLKRTSDWLVEKFKKLEDYLKEKETNFAKSEDDSRNELQKSRIVLAQEWKNLMEILGMTKTDLDKEQNNKK
jgi:predicted ATP-binding protein involved in virulence